MYLRCSRYGRRWDSADMEMWGTKPSLKHRPLPAHIACSERGSLVDKNGKDIYLTNVNIQVLGKPKFDFLFSAYNENKHKLHTHIHTNTHIYIIRTTESLELS